MDYILKSKRLGFRPWTQKDLPLLRRLNQDPQIMEHFPGALDEEVVQFFYKRLQDSFTTKGYCYFVVDLLETGESIGMIGLMDQDYESEFTPSVDIGWRIVPEHWRKGLASEGAKAMLEQAQDLFKTEEIYAFATRANTGSIKVMERIGMSFAGSFDHPKLLDYPNLKTCVAYRWKAQESK